MYFPAERALSESESESEYEYEQNESLNDTAAGSMQLVRYNPINEQNDNKHSDNDILSDNNESYTNKRRYSDYNADMLQSDDNDDVETRELKHHIKSIEMQIEYLDEMHAQYESRLHTLSQSQYENQSQSQSRNQSQSQNQSQNQSQSQSQFETSETSAKKASSLESSYNSFGSSSPENSNRLLLLEAPAQHDPIYETSSIDKPTVISLPQRTPLKEEKSSGPKKCIKSPSSIPSSIFSNTADISKALAKETLKLPKKSLFVHESDLDEPSDSSSINSSHESISPDVFDITSDSELVSNTNYSHLKSLSNARSKADSNRQLSKLNKKRKVVALNREGIEGEYIKYKMLNNDTKPQRPMIEASSRTSKPLPSWQLRELNNRPKVSVEKLIDLKEVIVKSQSDNFAERVRKDKRRIPKTAPQQTENIPELFLKFMKPTLQ